MPEAERRYRLVENGGKQDAAAVARSDGPCRGAPGRAGGGFENLKGSIPAIGRVEGETRAAAAVEADADGKRPALGGSVAGVHGQAERTRLAAAEGGVNDGGRDEHGQGGKRANRTAASVACHREHGQRHGKGQGDKAVGRREEHRRAREIVARKWERRQQTRWENRMPRKSTGAPVRPALEYGGSQMPDAHEISAAAGMISCPWSWSALAPHPGPSMRRDFNLNRKFIFVAPFW